MTAEVFAGGTFLETYDKSVIELQNFNPLKMKLV
jgi:hypothetical protein